MNEAQHEQDLKTSKKKAVGRTQESKQTDLDGSFAASMAALLQAKAEKKRGKARPQSYASPIRRPLLKQSIIGGVVGNVLEWYDFAVFGYFAPLIGEQFFPTQDPIASLLSVFGVFAVAYFMRPIGGILFGYIGDRFGRRNALLISVMMMAVPTFLIGLLPVYDRIGAAAPVMLVLLRLVQGLSVGGELIGSISFLTEIAPPGRRGFFGSWANGSAIGGIMLGSLVAMLLHNTMTPADLSSWGWRIPFLFGIVIGLIGLWMRRDLMETPSFEQMKQSGDIGKNPVLEALVTMPGRILHVAALVVLSGGGFYLLFVWWPTMLSQLIDPPVPHALMVNTISMAVLISLIPVSGWLSDWLGRKLLHVVGAASVALFAYPLFLLIDHKTFASALAAQLLFTVLISIFMGPVSATLAELFPSRTRYSGIAMGYNISLSVFGGTAPFVATWLVSRFNSFSAPACYLIFLSVVSLVAALYLPPRRG